MLGFYKVVTYSSVRDKRPDCVASQMSGVSTIPKIGENCTVIDSSEYTQVMFSEPTETVFFSTVNILHCIVIAFL